MTRVLLYLNLGELIKAPRGMSLCEVSEILMDRRQYPGTNLLFDHQPQEKLPTDLKYAVSETNDCSDINKHSATKICDPLVGISNSTYIFNHSVSSEILSSG